MIIVECDYVPQTLVVAGTFDSVIRHPLKYLVLKGFHYRINWRFQLWLIYDVSVIVTYYGIGRSFWNVLCY